MRFYFHSLSAHIFVVFLKSKSESMRFFLILFFISSLLNFQVEAQETDLVKTEDISSPIHKENIGKIIFTSGNIPLEKLKEKDFLSSYELTNKSNLFITAFLGNSITNYMHDLAPGLTADSLVSIGNYQFTFFIDGRMVHRSNISPDSRIDVQDSAKTIASPLIDNDPKENWMTWTQNLWGRFINNGGDSALTEGKHVLKLEIRPYVQMGSELKVGNLIASGELNLNVYLKPRVDLAKIHLNAITPYDGFPVSNEKFDVDKIKKLKAYVDEGVFKKINGVVVIKNGRILIEEYFNGDTRDSLHNPRSVGKTFASAMMGVAINDGFIKNENQKLSEFYDLHSFANYAPEKANITIKDLLTMSSVLDCDDNSNSPGKEDNMYPTANWVKFALDLPVNLNPPDSWHYCTAGAMLMGDLLNKTVPGGLEKYADEKLFSLLHITHYRWPYTPQHVPNTAGGIQLSALDFAKFGQLYKNQGKWNGVQVLSKEWVDKTFTKYQSIPGRKDEYYGYFFWNKKFKVNDKSYETFYCTGNGGNKIYVFTDQPLIVVVTASAYNTPYGHSQVDKMMTDFILPAVLDVK